MTVSETDRLDVIDRVEKRPVGLEERIDRLEARDAIHDVMMRYGHYCDSRSWDKVLSLYTDDVERVLTGTLDERVQGKEKLRELYLHPVLPSRDGRSLGAAAAATPGQDMTIRHMFAAPVIRVSDDGREGWLTAYFSLVKSMATDAGFQRHVHEGTYIFTFVKQGQDWKIRKMVVDTEIGHDPGFRPSS